MTDSSAWLCQMLARMGPTGIVRRQLSDVKKNGGIDLLVSMAQKKKWHVAVVGKQVIVFDSPIDVRC